MNAKIQLVSAVKDATAVEMAANYLRKYGFDVLCSNEEPSSGTVAFIVLTSLTKKADLFHDNLWIKRERKRSDIKTLRAMPFIVYRSHHENLDQIWDENIKETYDDLFSDEFKPFALDLDEAEGQIHELKQLLEKYYSK